MACRDRTMLNQFILLFSVLAVSIAILGLSANLLDEHANFKDQLVALPSSDTSAQPRPTTVSAQPGKEKMAGLILLLITGIGGTVDALILLWGLWSACRVAQGKQSAPRCLWQMITIVLAFSVARSLAAFIASYVTFYTSGDVKVWDGMVTRSGDREVYRSPDSRGFDFGAWNCGLVDVLSEDDDDDVVTRSHAQSLCRQARASLGLVLIQFIWLAVLAVMVWSWRRGAKRSGGEVAAAAGTRSAHEGGRAPGGGDVQGGEALKLASGDADDRW